MRELPIGTRVLLIREHPHAGRTGEIIIGLAHPSVGDFLPKMYTVRLDGDQHRCMAGPDDVQETTKRRLPPASAEPKQLMGPKVKSFTVGSWCTTQDGTGPPTAVGMSMEIGDGVHCVYRLSKPEQVDDVIQMLLRHKRDVWPEAK